MTYLWVNRLSHWVQVCSKSCAALWGKELRVEELGCFYNKVREVFFRKTKAEDESLEMIGSCSAFKAVLFPHLSPPCAPSRSVRSLPWCIAHPHSATSPPSITWSLPSGAWATDQQDQGRWSPGMQGWSCPTHQTWDHLTLHCFWLTYEHQQLNP